MNKKLWLILCVSLFTIAVTGQRAAALPPRPADEETPVTPLGASIQLQLTNAATGPNGVWTVVEWQNSLGSWYTVEGWQGTVELDGTQTWWLDASNFGTGPFRWRVFAQKDGTLLATSDSFYLPENANSTLPVPLTVAQ